MLIEHSNAKRPHENVRSSLLKGDIPMKLLQKMQYAIYGKS